MPEQDALPLVIRDLSFRYNSRSAPAIKNINLELHPGEVLLLAGSSGCGKTTLMRCINGLIPEAYHGEMTGDILLYGESVRGKKTLGYLSACRHAAARPRKTNPGHLRAQ